MIRRWLARIRLFFRRLFGGAPLDYERIFPIESGTEQLQQQIRQRLQTAPGEFFLAPDFGTNLRGPHVLVNRAPSGTDIAATLKKSGLVQDAHFDGKAIKVLVHPPADHIVLNIGQKP